MEMLQMFDSVLRGMLLSIFRGALLFACMLPVPYLSTVCATGLSTVNYACCRDARYAAFRRFEPPDLSTLATGLVLLLCFGCVSAINIELP